MGSEGDRVQEACDTIFRVVRKGLCVPKEKTMRHWLGLPPERTFPAP